MGIIFDRPEKTFRHELFPQYKANRQTTPEDLISQIEPLHKAIRDLGLPLIAQAGVEADDIIGTLAKEAEKQKISVLIASGDKDMAQLVTNNVCMIDSMKEMRLGPEEVKEKFGIGPESIIDYLTLTGDTSDNIPGVEKVGPKTAIKWLLEYGSLQGIIDHADQISGKVGDNLRASLDQLDLYKQLVTIDCQVKLNEVVSDLVIAESNDHALYTHFLELGLHGLIKQFQINPETEITKREVNYETVLSKPQLDRLIELILSSDAVAIDTETTSLNYIDAELVGISIATKANHGFYIPLSHTYEEAPKQLDRNYVLRKLKAWLEDKESKKISVSIKRLSPDPFETKINSYEERLQKSHPWLL